MRALPGAADWCRVWRALGAGQCDESLREGLIALYDAPQRHYHTTQHLAELFALWPLVEGDAEHPAEVQLAIWYHDAVYDAARSDNEARSAAMAKDAMRAAGVPKEARERVERLILATRHEAVPTERDAQILVDLDLAILGASAERFDEYEAQVRAEYAFVPDAPFRRGRAAVLAGFAARARIYLMPALYDRFEAAARENLRRSPYTPS